MHAHALQTRTHVHASMHAPHRCAHTCVNAWHTRKRKQTHTRHIYIRNTHATHMCVYVYVYTYTCIYIYIHVRYYTHKRHAHTHMHGMQLHMLHTYRITTHHAPPNTCIARIHAYTHAYTYIHISRPARNILHTHLTATHYITHTCASTCRNVCIHTYMYYTHAYTNAYVQPKMHAWTDE